MMKGVTPKGIFSDSGTVPTGLDLSMRNWSVHGSTLMRPPSGSAAITLAAGFASASGDCAENTAATMVQLLESLSPRCGLFLVRRIAQEFRPLELRCLFLFRGARKIKVAKRFFFVESHTVEERELRVHTMPEHHMAQLVRQNRRQTGFIRKHIDQSAAQDDSVAQGEGLQR